MTWTKAEDYARSENFQNNAYQQWFREGNIKNHHQGVEHPEAFEG